MRVLNTTNMSSRLSAMGKHRLRGKGHAVTGLLDGDCYPIAFLFWCVTMSWRPSGSGAQSSLVDLRTYTHMRASLCALSVSVSCLVLGVGVDNNLSDV